MPTELVYQIVLGLLAAGAVYGGIRADLKAIHERLAHAIEAAKEANRRLDTHLEIHHDRRNTA